MISEKEKFFDPRKPFASKRPETHEEWQARMGGEVLTVVRSGLYLDFEFSANGVSINVRKLSIKTQVVCDYAIGPTLVHKNMAAIPCNA